MWLFLPSGKTSLEGSRLVLVAVGQRETVRETETPVGVRVIFD